MAQNALKQTVVTAFIAHAKHQGDFVLRLDSLGNRDRRIQLLVTALDLIWHGLLYLDPRQRRFLNLVLLGEDLAVPDVLVRPGWRACLIDFRHLRLRIKGVPL